MGSAVLVDQWVRFLEMDAPERLRPARPVPGLAVVEVDDPAGSHAAWLRALHDEVGAGHRWEGLAWDDRRWHRWLSSSRVRAHVVLLRDEPIGLAFLHLHEPAEVEIATFGLLPHAIGRGYGGAALTEVVRIAWSLPAPNGGPVERVWLQTTSDDHANALPNYRARGFTVCAEHPRRRRLPARRHRSLRPSPPRRPTPAAHGR